MKDHHHHHHHNGSQVNTKSLRRRAQEFFLMDTIENILRSKPTDVIIGAFLAIAITAITFFGALLCGNYTVAMLVIFIWIMSP